jgi:hypothetical protein
VGVLRKLFGPSCEEMWRQLSTELGARYVEGGFWKGDRVEASHGEWTVTLDIFLLKKQAYTRLRAPYVNPDGFRFTIYRRGLFSDIAKWLGMQDVEIGVEDFDRDFIIKGTDASRLRVLFGNQRIRDLMAQQPSIHFTVNDGDGLFARRFPETVDELCFSAPVVIKDVARLKGLYELFAEILDQLCRMGSAYESPPGVEP